MAKKEPEVKYQYITNTVEVPRQKTKAEEFREGMGVIFCVLLGMAAVFGIVTGVGYVVDRLDDIKQTRLLLQQHDAVHSYWSVTCPEGDVAYLGQSGYGCKSK